MRSCIVDRQNLSLYAAASETSGNQNAILILQHFIDIVLIQLLGINPVNNDFCLIRDPAVLQGFYYAKISVMKSDVFSDKGDADTAFQVAQRVHHVNPVCQIRFRTRQLQGFQDNLSQLLPFHCQRSLIQIIHIQILQDVAIRHITKQRDFILQVLIQRHLGTAHNNVRLNPHSLQLFDALLGRLGFQFSGSLQVRDQGNMDQRAVARPLVMHKLTDCLQERLALNISDRTTDLNNGNAVLIDIFGAVKSAFDFICDMRNDLHGSPAVITVTLFLQNRPVHLPGRHIGIFVQALINKTLIMSQIQVCLRSVIRDIYFSVLNGIHGSRINIDVRIKFLHGNLVASGLEQTAQGSRSDALSEPGNYSACDKYVFY